MTLQDQQDTRVLAIDPTTKGFGFAVFEGRDYLVDWGVVYVGEEKNRKSLDRITSLLNRYSPDVLVVENHTARACRRRARARDLLAQVAQLARRHGVAAHRVSIRAVHRAFSQVGMTTKYEIAGALASQYPELVPRLPRKRKPWMSEDAQMGMFDAAAFAVAYFEFREGCADHA